MCWFFFFKLRTAYQMRISDWSSDVCSSYLRLLCGKFLMHVPDFLGAPLANDVLKEPGSVACIERANHRADLTEDCAFLGNGEVTTHLKDIEIGRAHV